MLTGKTLNDTIAITGMGLTTCLGVGVDANRSALLSGRSALGPVTRFDVGDYPVRVGGEASEPGCDSVDGGTRSFEELHLTGAIREACRQAGLPDARVPNDVRAAMSIGSSLAGSSTSERFFESYVEVGAKDVDYGMLEGYYLEDLLERLGDALGVDGPTALVSNACAAGGSSIAQAARWIRAGRADISIAVGFDPLSIFTFAGFGSLMALSRSRIRPFDARRDGMLLGDGFAALVLEPLESARDSGRTVRGILSGYGESTDAHHLTHPHPEGLGAALAMRRALEMAGIAPEDIGYINCHGTGTKPNDRSETRAMRTVFEESIASIPVSSSKPFFGHTLGGAGTVEAVVTLLALAEGVAPANLNLEEIDPEMDALDVVTAAREVRMRHAMSNSFGFGGCNTSLVFSRAEASS